MGRESLEINGFQHGILSAVDKEDIPSDAASYSLDVDNNAPEGRLMGRKGDDEVAISGGASVTPSTVAMIRGSSDDLVIHNPVGETISLIEGYSSGGTITTLGSLPESSDTTQAAMTVNNRAVHIGLGHGSLDIPKWAGYIDHKLFKGASVADIQYLDAEVKAPSAIPFLSKIIAYNTGGKDYVIGVEWDGGYVYKINVTDDVVTKTPTGTFSNVRSLCEDSVDSTVFWMFAKNTTHGTLYKMLKADLTIRETITLGSVSLPSDDSTNYYISDIEQTDSYVYFAVHKEPSAAAITQERVLYRLAKTAATGTAPTAMSPRIVAGSNAAGEWVTRRDFYQVRNLQVTDLGGGTTRITLSQDHGYSSGNSVTISGVTGASAGVLNATHVITVTSPSQYTIPVTGSVGAGDNPGYSLRTVTPHYIGTATNIAETFRTSLVRLSATQMGWAARWPSSVVTNYGGYQDTTSKYVLSGGTVVTIQAGVAVIDEGAPHASGQVVPFLDINASVDGSIGISSVKWIAASTRLIFDIGDYIYYYNYAAIPTVDGTLQASTAFGASSKTYNAATTGLIGTTLYSSRTSGAPAIVTLTATLGTPTTVYNGSDISLTINDDTGRSTFRSSFDYSWKYSVVYDGVQESPLSLVKATPASATEYAKDVVITVPSGDAISKRISHINIYRAAARTGADTPSSFYRLVKSVALDDAGWVYLDNGSHEITVHDDDEVAVGAAYEANSGLPETLERSIVHYGLAVELNGNLFVARCYHPDLPDASHFIFRSQPFRYDTFNWATDYLRLPFIPVAMVAYQGRLYAFDRTAIYRINPDLYIEDIMLGVGALHKETVCVTESGLYFCNRDNVFHFDGKQITPIGEGIRSTAFSDGVSWSGMTFPSDSTVNPVYPRVLPLQNHNSVAFIVRPAQNQTYAFVWHTLKKRWDYWTLDTGKQPHGAFVDQARNLVVVTLDNLYATSLWQTIGTSATRKAWTWISGMLGMGQATQNKRWYKIEVTGTGSPTITRALPASDTTFASFSPPASADAMRVKVVGTNSQEVSTLSVIFRRMVGLR